MKILSVRSYRSPIVIMMIFATALLHSAPPMEKPKAGATTTDPAAAIPRSVFTIPSNFGEGRDPFYPNARYMFGSPKTVTQTQTRIIPGADSLQVNGISGTADHKLAIINFRTVAEGETNEVLTVSGRVRFRCVEIKNQSVVIDVIGGERRELRLRD